MLLPKELKESILKDIDEFCENSTAIFYNEIGLKYKRGYLLSGIPGSGKTRTCLLLAKMKDMSVVHLKSHEMSSIDKFNKAFESFNNIACGKCLIIDDVDCYLSRVESRTLAKQDKEKQDEKQVQSVFQEPMPSLVDFLYQIDNIRNGNEPTMIFMTTNFPEKLDPALIRSGRFDKHFKFGYCTPDQVESMVSFITRQPSFDCSWILECEPIVPCDMIEALISKRKLGIDVIEKELKEHFFGIA